MIRKTLDFLGKEGDNSFVVAGTLAGSLGDLIARGIVMVLVAMLAAIAIDRAHRALRHRKACHTAPARTEVTARATACYCDQTQYL